MPELALGVLLCPEGNRPDDLRKREQAAELQSSGVASYPAAEILFTEPKVRNSVLYTAGDTVTCGQLADTISSVLQRRVKRVLWTLPRLKEQLAADPNNPICKHRVVFAEGRGVAWPMGHTFNAQRALPIVGIERWMRDHLGREVTNVGRRLKALTLLTSRNS